MRITQHWLDYAKVINSPNFNERPIADDISLIVIHCISLPPGKFENGYIDDLFCNRLNSEKHPFFSEIHQLQVSAHLLIKRNGAIHQYVGFDKRAWHAGQSEYQGRSACNDFSIGIELEGTEDSVFESIQYQHLAAVINCLIKTYPNLSLNHIVGHSDVAPGRKSDPGECFDWPKLRQLLNTDVTQDQK